MTIGDNPRVAYRRATDADREPVFRVLATAGFARVPSLEVPELELKNFFLAELSKTTVGVAGYRVDEDGEGKTTLMAVEPAARGLGIGERLQKLRLHELRRLGCHRVRTNADLPETIDWYKRKFGYREVGRVAKLHPFGAPDVAEWTTLELDIEDWYRRRAHAEPAR